MATVLLTPELAGMAAFRASVNARPEPAMAETLDRLCAVGQFRRVLKGCELPVDPDEDRLVYIVAGAAKLVAQSLSGRTCNMAQGSGQGERDWAHSHILAFYLPGEIISVLRQVDADFHLIALTDLELVVFGADQFLDIAQTNPAVIRQVLSRSLQALHRSRTKMIQLGHKSARQRIADFLVSIAERICGCTEGRCEFSLPMSRRDIGNSLGLTIETVSRQLTDLREEGLVETHGRSGICLVDIGSLISEAGRS